MVSANEIAEINQMVAGRPKSHVLFYLWLVAKFGYGARFSWYDCLEYGVGRRQIYRYIGKLKEDGMIYKYGNGNATGRKYFIDPEGMVKKTIS